MFSKLASLGLALLPAITPEKGVIGLKRKFLLMVLVALIFVITMVVVLPCATLSSSGDEYAECAIKVSGQFLSFTGSDFKEE